MAINWDKSEYLVAGTYTFLVTDAKKAPTKRGGECVKLDWQVVGGDYDGKTQSMTIFQPDQYAEMMCAAGLSGDDEPERAINKRFTAELYKGGPNDAGKSFMRARNYQPVNGKATTPAAPKAAAATAKPAGKGWGKKAKAEPVVVTEGAGTEMSAEEFDALITNTARSSGETVENTYAHFAKLAGDQHGVLFPGHPDVCPAEQRAMFLNEVYKAAKEDATLMSQTVINWQQRFNSVPF